jgi:hypothetical protein
MSDDVPVILASGNITPADAAMFRSLRGVRFPNGFRHRVECGDVIDSDEINYWIEHFEKEENA